MITYESNLPLISVWLHTDLPRALPALRGAAYLKRLSIRAVRPPAAKLVRDVIGSEVQLTSYQKYLESGQASPVVPKSLKDVCFRRGQYLWLSTTPCNSWRHLLAMCMCGRKGTRSIRRVGVEAMWWLQESSVSDSVRAKGKRVQVSGGRATDID